MKKLLLLPILLGATLLGGCIEEDPYYYGRPAYYGGYSPGYGDGIYDEPYYSYGGVYYYYSGGRYYWLRGGRRIYVETLPYGGRYLEHRDHDRYEGRHRSDEPYADRKSKPHHEDSDHQYYSRFSNPPPVSATHQGPLPRYQTQTQPQSRGKEDDKKKRKHKDDGDR